MRPKFRKYTELNPRTLKMLFFLLKYRNRDSIHKVSLDEVKPYVNVSLQFTLALN